MATARRVGSSSTSQPPETSYGTEQEMLRLRIRTANIGSMSVRSGEVIDMVQRRGLDFCCLQETRWKGGNARMLGDYKFFWKGCKEGLAGVGMLVEKRWVDNVMEVKRVSERILTIRVRVGMKILNLVSVYAPQVGRARAEKEEFYERLFEVVSAINDKESLLLCGDLNGHVGQRMEGFGGVHGGFGFGSRNSEGEMILKFAESLSLSIANT